jgi:hypothetical protein
MRAVWLGIGFCVAALVGCGSQPGVLTVRVGLSDVNPAALAAVVVVFSTGDATPLPGSLGQVDTTQDGVRFVAAWRNGSSGPELVVSAIPFKASDGSATMDLRFQLASVERGKARAVTVSVGGFDATSTQITATETALTRFDPSSEVDVAVTLRCATPGACS